MIDNIKMYVSDKMEFENSIERIEDIYLKGNTDFRTGEWMEYPKRGKFHNLDINFTANSAILSGSLHKYSNSINSLEKQNYNDFSFCQYRDALAVLEKQLSFSSVDTRITNLEFGFNIVIDEDPQSVIDNKILMYDYKPVNRNQKFRGGGDFKEFQMTDYSFKIYNKSKQYKIMDRNIIRLELKITNSRFLKKLGINTLSNIDYNAFSVLYNTFMKHFEKLMVVDSISPPESLSLPEKVFFGLYVNPTQWQSIDTSINYRLKYQTQRKFDKILKNHSLLKTKDLLRDKISSKFIELMDCERDINVLQSVA